jgi:hypothetical protein
MPKKLTTLLILGTFWSIGLPGCGDKSPKGSDKSVKNGDKTPAEGDPVLEGPETTKVDLGKVDFGDVKKHTFTLVNRGGKPLSVAVAKKNCGCFEVEIKPPAPIPPGGKGEIVFHWTPRPGYFDRKELIVDFTTNDPKRPDLHLEVSGLITPKVQVLLPDKEEDHINFRRITAGERQERTIKVFSTEKIRFTLKAKVSDPAGLTVKTTPLPADSLVGSAGVKCGYEVVVGTSDKPPVGNFQETLELKVEGDENRLFRIPVYGEARMSTLFEMKPEDGEVEFKGPQLANEASKKVMLRFFNSPGTETVEVAERTPSFLVVHKEKKGKHWQITVGIPKDNPELVRYQANRYMEGRVVLKTSLPDLPQVHIRVVWDPPDPPAKKK